MAAFTATHQERSLKLSFQVFLGLIVAVTPRSLAIPVLSSILLG